VVSHPQTSYLKISVEGGILVLTIDNPPNNYLPVAFFEDLHNCRELILSSEVAAVIFTGTGKVFSKGVDLSEVTARPNALDHRMIKFANQLFTFISRLRKPVIAAINGPCLGGGLELALACHIRLCSEKARLGLPELSIGVIPGLGGIQRLIRVVGEAKALEMILLGDMIPATRALELNLVSRVFPKKDFFSRVLIFVRTLITARRQALAEALRLVALSRADKEEENVLAAAESFTRLLAKNLAESKSG
jgi:enoyl-CoA hydratase/carnithine racemase